MKLRNNQVTLDVWIGGFHFRQTIRASMRKGFELEIKNKGKNSVVAIAVCQMPLLWDAMTICS